MGEWREKLDEKENGNKWKGDQVRGNTWIKEQTKYLKGIKDFLKNTMWNEFMRWAKNKQFN